MSVPAQPSDFEVEELRQQGREQLPEAPLEVGSGHQTLTAFEVVLAKNLHPPYRYSQDYYWLEVLSSDERAAVDAAARWVGESETAFECTHLVRTFSEHLRQLGRGADGDPLPISWSLPIDDSWAPGTMIRNPITGIRVGFIASPKAESRWLSDSERAHYRLLLRKPVDDADPVCLGPLVKNVSPLR